MCKPVAKAGCVLFEKISLSHRKIRVFSRTGVVVFIFAKKVPPELVALGNTL